MQTIGCTSLTEEVKNNSSSNRISFRWIGRYQNKQKSTGKNGGYRFYEPEDKDFPELLESFSRIPDALAYEGKGDLITI